tara:strand:- start:70 stop:462 length:393 start_codon:yes stop_codon:yes gene_type:complete
MKIRKIREAFTDDRGTISDIFYKTKIDHVAIIKTKDAGKIIRGNHYHKHTTQHIYMTKGWLRYWYKQLNQESSAKFVDVKEGFIVSTPPLEIHALECFEANDFIVFSMGIRGGDDYESDTFRVDSIILEN